MDMSTDDVEKGLLSGEVGKRGQTYTREASADERRRSQHTLRQRRTWRLLACGIVFVCVCVSIVALEQKSLQAIGGATQWTTQSHADAVKSMPHASTSFAPANTLAHARPTPLASKPSSQKGAKHYEPTAALRKLASKLHQALPPISWSRPRPKEAKPLPSDHILLLLSAVRNQAYKFPLDAKERLLELQPSTQAAFAHMLRKVMPSGHEETDARMYTQEREQWADTHRASSPLTVFSKSYCPYSKRAKALLRSMGVHFDVYEVDLRDDAAGLQQALREVSGHATFPAIFLGDRLLGGSDDLARLQNTHALTGILQAAHVQVDGPSHAQRRDEETF